jgi:hypothetical protein
MVLTLFVPILTGIALILSVMVPVLTGMGLTWLYSFLSGQERV